MRKHQLPFALGIVPLLGLGGCGMISSERTPEITHATRLNVAMAAEASGDNQMALQLYATAVAKNPSDTNAVVLYARALVNARRIGLARELLARQLEAQPGQPALAREMATIDVLQGQPAAALPRFDLALAKDPNDVRALVNKAIALDMLGQHQEALVLYRRADTLSPDDATIRNNMAMSLMLAGRAGEAEQVMQNVASGPVALPRIRNNAAVVAASAGDMARARQLANGEISESELRSLAEQVRQREIAAPAPVAAAAPAAAAPAPDAPAPAPTPVAAAAPAVQPVAAQQPVAPVEAVQPAVQPAGAPVPLSVPDSNNTRRPTGEKVAPVRTEPPASPRNRQNMTAIERRITASVERAAEREMIDSAISLPPVLSAQVARPTGAASVIPAMATASMRIRVANMATDNEQGAAPGAAASGTAAPSLRARGPRLGWGVQLGALDSERMAQYAWGQMSSRMPELLDGRQGSIVQMIRNTDGRTFWRLRTFGFQSKDAAAEFCTQVKAQGTDCFPTRS